MSEAAGGSTRGRGGFLRLVGLVARREYLRTVRRRGYVFGTLLLPISIAAIAMVGSLVPTAALLGPPDPGSVTLVVVDESTVDLAPGVDVLPTLQLVDRATAEGRLAEGDLAEYYLVPDTWPGSPSVTRVSRAGAGLDIAGAQRQEVQVALLEAVLRHVLLDGAALDPATETRVLTPLVLDQRTQDGQAVSDLSIAAGFLLPLAFALLFVLSIFITSGYLLQSVTEEKENRVVEIVLSSVPSLPLMAGKIAGLGGAGLTQVAVWLATALLAVPIISEQLEGVDLGIEPAVIGLALAYFVMGYLAYGAIFAAIGALAPGNREAQQYSGFLGFIAVIPLIFSSVLLTDPTSPIAWALAAIPLTAPATMLLVLGLAEAIPWGMVALSLVSLALFVVVATVASARIFRATLLLYGVRPSLRQLADAVLARG